LGPICIVAVLSLRCASTMAPLTAYDSTSGYRFKVLKSGDNGNNLFIVLALSGGGTRAAAFAYGVLSELHSTHINGGRRLLDEVDLISSVSGGSFTAAYYSVFRERTFTSFEPEFLYRRNTARLVGSLLRPDHLVKLLFTRWNRS